MSTIRRQSIISSMIVYVGFAIGLFNTYLYTREGGFTKEQYGLTAAFIAYANIMYAVASLGMPAYISKFFPYYHSHLPDRKNDLLGRALLISLIGFAAVALTGITFKDILLDKILNNSPQLLQYYYWLFPFGLGYTIFLVLEAYAWQRGQAIASNFLKEVMFRLIITGLIVATSLHWIHDFSVFIAIYAFAYLAIMILLLFHFYRKNQLHLTLEKSKVSRRFSQKIITLCSFVWAGGLVFNLASVFDTMALTLAIPNGLAAVALFTLAQNISSLMQAPQRAVISASIGPLSAAWKEKDYGRISRIYHRSSINQLIFAVVLFVLIWLNFDDAITTFHLQEGYRQAKWVFFFLGLTKIIDMGTGLNSQIIATSTFWRFEFVSGLVLLALMLPLTWQLTRLMGPLGPAISNLVSFTIYNAFRYWFLWTRFNMQPFTWKSLFTVLLGAAGYLVCYPLFEAQQGFIWLCLRSISFLIIFVTGMWFLQLTPDAAPVFNTVKKRLRPGR